MSDCIVRLVAASSLPVDVEPVMSCVPVPPATVVSEVCANCGKEGHDANDDAAALKLKNCTACLLVKYCGVDCQKAHRKQHKKACKLRAAELDDEKLYGQGHERSEFDVCPICTLPIPLPESDHSVVEPCCAKRICIGCERAAKERGILNCPFCRTPLPTNEAGILALIQARVEKKDPDAINHLAEKYFHGKLGLQKDVQKGAELITEAAALGSTKALFNLGVVYSTGMGVEKDEAKSIHYYKKAAMQGNVQSRHNLGLIVRQKGDYDRAVRHLLISAKMGHNNSLEMIKVMFMIGLATKEQYSQALKGHQDAWEEMMSPEREMIN